MTDFEQANNAGTQWTWIIAIVVFALVIGVVVDRLGQRWGLRDGDGERGRHVLSREPGGLRQELPPPVLGVDSPPLGVATETALRRHWKAVGGESGGPQETTGARLARMMRALDPTVPLPVVVVPTSALELELMPGKMARVEWLEMSGEGGIRGTGGGIDETPISHWLESLGRRES